MIGEKSQSRDKGEVADDAHHARARAIVAFALAQTAENHGDRLDALGDLMLAAAIAAMRDCGLPPDALAALILSETPYA